MKNRYKIALILAVATASLLGYWHFSQPKESEEMFTGEFGSGQFRNTETKNLSPYAMFGDSSFVLMTEEERTGKHTLSIPSKMKDSPFSKIEIQLKTGLVLMYGKRGNVINKFYLPANVQAKFLQIDPRAEKYYDLSPYNYVANNPILNIDPNGDTIAVSIEGIGYKYIGGSLQSSDGTVYNPEEGSFGHGILSALNKLSESGDVGKSFIGELSNMSEYVLIKEGTLGRNVTSGVSVLADLAETQRAITSNGFEPIPFDIILGHELGHAYANAKGAEFKDWTTIKTTAGDMVLSSSEIYASHIENMFRSAQGLPVRRYYSPDQYGKPVYSTQLTDNNNRSLFFQSNTIDFNSTSTKRLKKDLRYGY